MQKVDTPALYLLLKCICCHRCQYRYKTNATGDFVAMMQGGLVDHQRALDAVAQVIASQCAVCVSL
jgi:hypothetical protein